MIRDLLGNKIKKDLSKVELKFLEKFYINNNKVFQLLRIKRYHKMDGEMVEFSFINPLKALNKVKSKNLSSVNFNKRKYYTSFKEAQQDTTVIDDYISFECESCGEKHYRALEISDRMRSRIKNNFIFEDTCNDDLDNYISVQYNIVGEKELSIVDLSTIL